MNSIGEFSFRSFQEMATSTDQVPRGGEDDQTAIMVPLLGLAGESGSLLSEFKKWLRQGDIYKPFQSQVSEELGDILWYVSNIATKLDLDLEEIARNNLAKVDERFRDEDPDGQAKLFDKSRAFDDGYPEGERLPRDIFAEFKSVSDGGRNEIDVVINGKSFGDRLTDNSHSDDGYRFHDVFHLTLCCRLGWSPIMRKLLGCKRKSDERVDEVEDGARAGITEEAISAVAFGFAQDYSMFDCADSIEFSLLRTINEMTRPFEVKCCSFREWEKAILEAFAVWRQMITNNGGVFIGSKDEVSYKLLDETP